jgi:hypothetical protein
VRHAKASSDDDTKVLRDLVVVRGGSGRLDAAVTAFVRDWLLGLVKTRCQHLDEGAVDVDVGGGGDSEYVTLLEGAGTVALAMGKHETLWLADAEASFRSVLQRLGTSDLPRAAKAQTLLAQSLLAQQRYEEAESLLSRAHTTCEAVGGLAHPDTVAAAANLLDCLDLQVGGPSSCRPCSACKSLVATLRPRRRARRA